MAATRARVAIGAAAVLAVFGLAGGAAAQPGGHVPDPAAGKEVALNVCAWCHMTGPGQTMKPTLRPPAASFPTIANRTGVTADWLQRFIVSRHPIASQPHEMPNPELSDNQAADVAAYIMSQRRGR